MNHQQQQLLQLQNMLSILNRGNDDRNNDTNERNRNDNSYNNNNNNNNNTSSFSTFFSGLFLSGIQSYLQQDRRPIMNHLERAMENYITQSNIDHMMDIIQQNLNENMNDLNENNMNNVNIRHHYNNNNNDDGYYSYRFEAYYENNENNQNNENDHKENLNNEYNGKIVIPCELDEKVKERYSQYDSCSICFEDFDLNDPSLSIALTECKHAYHLSCINEWFKRKKDCPVCRKTL